ncbi:transporter [Seminavis robusta]|uniref:Transporter n=1 Tax=Seminavis robusta TaxID=568900 RepID=A0A9N8DV82_9STRA|nr:transporter [Seminavis robusta]|eukprot:Sro368_g127960.1 transporter (818) ;mRNA; f:32619-35242
MSSETEAKGGHKDEPTKQIDRSVSIQDSSNELEQDAERKRKNLSVTQSGTNLLADIANSLEIPQNLDDTEQAVARFDVSPFRLWLLFQSVDENQDGYIMKQELVHALASASTTNKNGENVAPAKAAPLSQQSEQTEGEEGLEEIMPLQDIRALDELFDRVICKDDHPSYSASETTIDDDGETQEYNNCIPVQSVGISFPQFCRIIRYLWLQQLMIPELDSDDADDNGNGYAFEYIDYAPGYHRHKQVSGSVSEKQTRDFFIAPRHGLARMRWIDVPSGTFVGFAAPATTQTADNPRRSQKESFRITMLRLAVKYRFHPTSIEDAIDLENQEPKVNSFEHSLLDLGKFNCGTLSWLRHAGDGYEAPDVDAPSFQKLGDWALDAEMSRKQGATLATPTNTNYNSMGSLRSIPKPAKAVRASSTHSFHSYQREAAIQGRISNVPDFIIAEGEDDINVNEGRHYFITVPMFELSRRSKTSLDLYNEASELLPVMQVQPLTIEVNEATLGMFVASLPDANLVVTCSTKWRPTRIKPVRFNNNGDRNASRRHFFSYKNTNTATSVPPYQYGSIDPNSSNSDSSGDSGGSDDPWIADMLQDEKLSLERVKNLLKKRHSIQRHRNSNWLMHAILDAVVDNLVPISKIYEAQLQRMSNRLFELQEKLSKRDVKEMIVMKRDLEWLQHEIRPFARVIRHLIDDRNIGIEVTHYLEDIEDNLMRTLEQLSSFADECVTLKDEYNAYSDRRTNDILYILTLVTTLIVPGQFFTGYYGMNFIDPETELPALPLLNQGGWGVFSFWCISLAGTAMVALMMYRYGFLQKEIA